MSTIQQDPGFERGRPQTMSTLVQIEKNTHSQWLEKSTQLKPESRAFIDGQYRDAASGKTFDCVNPATGKLLCKVASCDQEDVNQAVTAARRVFENGDWRHADPAERKRVLLAFAEKIRENTEELSLLETLDMGKPITDSLTVDIPLAADTIAWYAEAIDKSLSLIHI